MGGGFKPHEHPLEYTPVLGSQLPSQAQSHLILSKSKVFMNVPMLHVSDIAVYIVKYESIWTQRKIDEEG